MKRSALWIALCATAWCSRARADAVDVELSWSAPTGCPQLIEVEAEIVRRLGRPLATEGPALEANGVIETSERGFRLQLTTDLLDEQGARTLEAPRCEELASAAAVIVALLADPHADTTPAAVPAPPPEPPAQPKPKPKPAAAENIEIEEPDEPTSRPWRELGIALRPELVADLGTLPAFAIGPGLTLGVRVERTAFEIFGSYLPPNTASRNGRSLGTLELWSAGAGICHAFGRKPSLSPCLRFEYGRMPGKGQQDIRKRQQGTGRFAALFAGLRVDFPLIRGLGLGAELQVGLPVARTLFTVDGVGKAHEPSVVIARTRAGVELQF